MKKSIAKTKIAHPPCFCGGKRFKTVQKGKELECRKCGVGRTV